MANDPRRQDEPIADANDLYRDTGARKRPEPKPPVIPLGDSYDVEGGEPDEEPPVRRAPIAPKRPSKPRANIEREEPRAPKVEATVEEIWTRGAEWGPTAMLLGIVFGVTLVVSYLAADNFGLAVVIFLLGLVSVVLLSYPMAVTMERPVRMTPEQALKDYYAAASHHFPHYRRMWLLLSDEGRNSAEFSSYATFRTYWKHRMAKLRGGKVGAMTPLAFSILDFKSDKSAGQTSVDASYSISVKPRTEGASVLKEVSVDTSFVRGPDKMWYVNLGTLPD